MSDRPHPAVRFVIRHWERVTVALVGAVVVAFGVITALGLAAALRAPTPKPPSGGQQVHAAFDDKAFDYLKPTTATVGDTHALRVAGGPKEEDVVEIEIDDTIGDPDPDTLTRSNTVVTVITDDDATGKKTVIITTPDTDNLRGDPEPEPADRYLTYQGFMTLPSGGDPQAFFLREQGMDSEQAKSPSGGLVDGLTIQAFDENTVTLRTADGQRIVIRRGERRQLTP